MDEYISFCQPLVTSVPADALQISPADQASWKQHMIQLHHAEANLAGGTTMKRSRAARGGTKRKREMDDDNENSDNNNNSDHMVWRLEEMLENQKHDKSKNHKRFDGDDTVVLGGEDEALAMEYLHSSSGGNVEVGKFNALVHFTAGQGTNV